MTNITPNNPINVIVILTVTISIPDMENIQAIV